ncbi:hypothetical protein [Geodermatophilus sp. URMC 64]
MRVLTWLTALLCALQGGYLLLDGVRALVVGSYITPRSGEHAGELGPWARLVAAVGIPPESTGMKLAFAVLGLLWLVLALGVVLGASWAWVLGLALAVATLWYLVPGTVLSLLVLVLLLTPPVRRALGRG